MKITRAMELIAASRIVKAQQRVFEARPYADLLTSAMEDVARQTGFLVHPLLEEREHAERAGVLVMTSDRGLAGSYNANLLKRLEGVLGRVRRAGLEPVIYAVGKKAIGYFRFRAVSVEASWSGFSEVPNYPAAEEVGERLIRDYAERRIDQLYVVYTDFRTSFTFRATDKRFLPIAPEEIGRPQGQPSAEYLFEPEPAEILDDLLPQYVVTKIFFALLESAAAENAARQRAMAAATDNAEELIKVLTRQANRARQDEITTEIMEIVGGAEALAHASGGSGG
jgi:F-type H+-transporting ATPase subunit gamma